MNKKEEAFDPNKTLIVFGENIRKAREKNNFTISTLAQKTNYDRICLSKVEIGKQNLEYMTSIKLARALNVSYPDLFSRNYIDHFLVCNTKPSIEYCNNDYLLNFINNFKLQISKFNKLQKNIYIDTGISESMVSRIINQQNKNPTLKTLSAMAYTINMDLCTLFRNNKEEKNI